MTRECTADPDCQVCDFNEAYHEPQCCVPTPQDDFMNTPCEDEPFVLMPPVHYGSRTDQLVRFMKRTGLGYARFTGTNRTK